MRAFTWMRDWAIITVCPWVAIYLLVEGPMIWGFVLLALTYFAVADRASHQ